MITSSVRPALPDLPVLRSGDVLVVGGSLAGVAAALSLAQAGRHVILIEPRTFLGREITATGRPWVVLPTQPGIFWRELISRMEIDHVAGIEIPLKMDDLKLVLEDVLLGAGVDLLYASIPTALYKDGNGIPVGVIIGNKSGRQVIEANTLIDATETALLSRLGGESFAPGEPAIYTRTLEFDGVCSQATRTLSVPPHLGILADSVALHPGYRGEEHIFVELALEFEANDGPEAFAQREISARHTSMALAAYLIGQIPAFSEATLGSSSLQLCGPQAPPLLPTPSPGLPALPGLHPIGSVPNLWRLNEPSGLSSDPVTAAEMGEALGHHIAQQMPAERLSVNADHTQQPSHGESLSIREPESPQRGRSYPRVAVPRHPVPVSRNVDVLVVGGGTSGATAAITAGREGVDTVLVEMNLGLGGTGTLGGVNSYWYGRHVGFSQRTQGLVDEVHHGLGHTKSTWNIEAKMYALLREAEAAGVHLLFPTVAIGAVVGEEGRVCGAALATPWGPSAILAEVTIDATGDGDIAAFAGAEVVYGAECDHSVMWYSLAQFSTPGRTRNNFTSAVDVSNVEDYTRAILAGRRRGSKVHDHGTYVATRESRHILAGTVMTHTDQLTQRHWPDVVNIHYSNHDVKGVSTSPWVRMGLIPPNLEIEVPYRILLPRGLTGILLAGKAMSATHDALPAIRMQADLENLGGAVALAAAQAVHTGRLPHQIDRPALQQRLIQAGLLSPDVLNRADGDARESDLRELVASLDGARPLYTYSDMEMGELFEGRIPMVDICTAGPDIVPFLIEALDTASGLRRVHLAQALAFYGHPAAVPILVGEIEQALVAGNLPIRDSAIRHAGYPPDQGAMPDVVYLLYSLGMVRDPRAIPVWERIVDLLQPSEDDMRDRRKGTFYYVGALSWSAGELGDPDAIPLLQRLHAAAPLHGQVCRQGFQADFFQERQAMLELALARALARCGSCEGYETLIDYLSDTRALLAEQAHAHLSYLSGEDFGKDEDSWRCWLSRSDLAAHLV